jgi:hypothetical protein
MGMSDDPIEGAGAELVLQVRWLVTTRSSSWPMPVRARARGHPWARRGMAAARTHRADGGPLREHDHFMMCCELGMCPCVSGRAPHSNPERHRWNPMEKETAASPSTDDELIAQIAALVREFARNIARERHESRTRGCHPNWPAKNASSPSCTSKHSGGCRRRADGPTSWCAKTKKRINPPRCGLACHSRQ